MTRIASITRARLAKVVPASARRFGPAKGGRRAGPAAKEAWRHAFRAWREATRSPTPSREVAR